jgi:hypothetical protein
MTKAVDTGSFLMHYTAPLLNVLTQTPRIFEERHASFLIDRDGTEYIARVLFGDPEIRRRPLLVLRAEGQGISAATGG